MAPTYSAQHELPMGSSPDGYLFEAAGFSRVWHGNGGRSSPRECHHRGERRELALEPVGQQRRRDLARVAAGWRRAVQRAPDVRAVSGSHCKGGARAAATVQRIVTTRRALAERSAPWSCSAVPRGQTRPCRMWESMCERTTRAPEIQRRTRFNQTCISSTLSSRGPP